MRVFVQLILLLVLLVSPACAADYLADIKPLLQHKCYACHGALKQQGGLRLDTAAALIRGGESGPAVIPGQPGQSLLLDVLTGDAGFKMPPANEGAPLTSDQTDLIRQWIADGAPLPETESPQTDPRAWWSYQPIGRPPRPQVRDADWCRSEIDHFVAAIREQHGLPAAGEATKPQWLRRVSLDLTGLPPTREELHRFLADDSEKAYAAVVDDLLSRPQYGERWGRHWMDIWRYSDWYGSRGINEIRYSQRHIWRWRDWIIQSLNEDRGYDRMIREMLAADELPAGNTAALPATGYLGRNWYKFDRNVWMFETVERTGEAFLGLTLRCCRCHDHKFDPVSQEEYYRFRAFFEPHDVRTDPLSALTGTQKDATLGQVLNDGIALVYDKTPDAPTYLFERGDSRYPDESRPLAPGVPAALGGSLSVSPVSLPVDTWYPMLRPGVRKTLIDKADADVAAAEETLHAALQTAAAAEQKLTAAKAATNNKSADSPAAPPVFLEDDFSAARPDTWEIINGTWNYQDEKLVQSAVTSFATMVTKKNLPGDVHIHLRYRPLRPGTYRSIGFSFDYRDKGNSQDVYTSTGDSRQSVQAFHRLDGKQVYPQAGIVSTTLNVEEEAVFDVSVIGSGLTIDLNGERKLEYTMPVERRDGRFALWVHQGAAEFLELRITEHAESLETLTRKHEDTRRAVHVAQAEKQLAQAVAESVRRRLDADIAKYLHDDEAAATAEARAARRAELAVAVCQAQVDLARAAGSEQKQAAEKSLAAAQQAVADPAGDYTAVGEQFPRTSTGRRSALAAWMTHEENPRTARVAANHIWGRHFGRPLVTTPENFGLNGRQPSHPALLDWLAAELMSSGWRMKPLHRKIVLSSTYRMSSRMEDTPQFRAARQTDPDNQYLWHRSAGQMEAEVVRDAALYLAGRLDLTLGGPEIPETDGEKTLRRSLYFRNTPNEKMAMLEVFDAPDPNSCYRRKQSIVPHQSLALMNSGLTQDSARVLAGQLADAEDFVTAAFETVLCRAPSPDEAARCQTFLTSHTELLKSGTASAFPAGGSAGRTPAANPAARARENLVHVLLLHNDFVTIR